MERAQGESVWDYPRPPRLERSGRRIRVSLGGGVIADTVDARRVLETSHPPVYYVPLADVLAGVLEPSSGRGASFCEWKGMAHYYDAIGRDGSRVAAAAWGYADPSLGFRDLRDTVAFYPALMDECTVDGELVEAQPGDFYGGWITSEIVGPFKGAPGTHGW
jgi:uncharacterized protein (DUF427 family)